MSDLPIGWAIATVDDVTLPVAVVDPKVTPDQTFAYVDIGSIDNRSNRIADPKSLLGRDAPSRARQLLRVGDTVVSTVRTYLRNIGFVDSSLAGAIGSTGFAVLRPAHGIHPRFLYYYSLTNAFVDGLSAQMRGTSYPAVVDSQVRAMGIPVPPIAEQTRIVAAIEEQFSRLDAATSALDRVTHSLKRMRASVLASTYKAAADEVGTSTLSRVLGNDALFVDGDWVESKDQDPTGDHRLTQLADIGDGVWRNRSSRFMNAEQFTRLDCKPLRVGDVLVARMPDPLGRACIFPGDAMPCATVVDVAIIRPADNWVNARWLMWSLNSPQVRSQIAALAKGTTRRRVSRSNLGTIAIPKLEFQAQLKQLVVLESNLEAVSRIEQAVGVARLRHAALRRSILTSAFSGGLAPQDPSDEPAFALLERVARERASFNGHKSSLVRKPRSARKQVPA